MQRVAQWQQKVYHLKIKERDYSPEKWLRLRKKVLKRDRYRCQRCGKFFDNSIVLSIHHIVPYEYSHNNHIDNLITLCNQCHDYVELYGIDQLITDEKENNNTAKKGEWHKWVYGGQKIP